MTSLLSAVRQDPEVQEVAYRTVRVCCCTDCVMYYDRAFLKAALRIAAERVRERVADTDPLTPRGQGYRSAALDDAQLLLTLSEAE